MIFNLSTAAPFNFFFWENLAEVLSGETFSPDSEQNEQQVELSYKYYPYFVSNKLERYTRYLTYFNFVHVLYSSCFDHSRYLLHY